MRAAEAYSIRMTDVPTTKRGLERLFYFTTYECRASLTGRRAARAEATAVRLTARRTSATLFARDCWLVTKILPARLHDMENKYTWV